MLVWDTELHSDALLLTKPLHCSVVELTAIVSSKYTNMPSCGVVHHSVIGTHVIQRLTHCEGCVLEQT